MKCIDDATGQRLFQPRLNKTTEKILQNSRPQVKVEDLLHYKGTLYKQNALLKEKRQDMKAQMIRSAPKVNSMSERLNYERYVTQGETPQDRLSKPIGSIKPKVILEAQQELTFQPKIGGDKQLSSKSGDIILPSRSKSNNRPRYSYNNNDSSYTDQTYLQMNDVMQGGEPIDPFCDDFYYKNQPQQKSINNHSKRNSDIYLRSKKWDEDRKQRINIDREFKEQQDYQECSFQPKISTDSQNILFSSESLSESNSSRNYILNSSNSSLAERNNLWQKKK
jgi:hypothetical protein